MASKGSGQAAHLGTERAFPGVSSSLRLLPPVLPTAYDRAFRRANHALREVVARVVAKRREHMEDRGDLLSMFMLARDEETGEQMDDAHLQNEVLTMLLAGHETTATALSWAWALLHQNPETEKRLHEELDAVLGGPRQCIGNNFALMEGTLLLATLAQHHRPRMVAGYTPMAGPHHRALSRAPALKGNGSG